MPRQAGFLKLVDKGQVESTEYSFLSRPDANSRISHRGVPQSGLAS